MSHQVASPPVRRRDLGDLWLALAFITPALIGFLVFLLWPTLRGIWLSFTDFNLLTPAKFVGFNNFIRMSEDPVFWNSAKVTLLYVIINIGVQTVVSLVIAVMMHRLTQSTFVRSIVLAPYLVANVVAAMVFLWILDTQLGVANQVIVALGMDRIPFLNQESTVIPTIALINVWRHMGYTALLIFAGLQMIPETVYEAARVDGASEWRTFWRITMPMLMPGIIGAALLSFALSFDDFIITNFNAGTATTFPKFIYVSALKGVPAQANVLASIVFIGALVLVIVVQSINISRQKKMARQ